MSFWQNQGFTYQSLADLTRERLVLVTDIMTREDLIEWLRWNDPNGIYEDEQSLKELGNVLTREEGLEILVRQIEENRVI